MKVLGTMDNVDIYAIHIILPNKRTLEKKLIKFSFSVIFYESCLQERFLPKYAIIYNLARMRVCVYVCVYATS